MQTDPDRSDSTDYDVIVLGAGNAGIAAASAARAAGQRVAIVEARDVGGVCPLRGCVPKKVFVAAAQALDQIERAGAHHIHVPAPRLDWRGLVARARGFVEGVPAELEKTLAERGIERIRGLARFVGPRSVEVAGSRLEAGRFVVATGSVPRSLPIPGAAHLLTSEDLLSLDALPESIAFVGAGVIALEFAHVLARAGTRVTLLEAAPRVLPGLDPDATSRLAALTRDLGVAIETGVRVERIERRSRGHGVRFTVEGATRSLESEWVVNGAGRVPNLAALDLPAAGIACERGQVPLDPSLRSAENPAVSFAGDAVPGRPQLSPLATYEGRLVGTNLVRDDARPVANDRPPAVIHTVPALATVGLDERGARAAGLDFDVRESDMREWRSARTHAERDAWAKVLVERGSRRILGAALLGHGAEETIHAFATAIDEQLTADRMAERVYAYPTFHADLKYVV